MHTSKIMSQFQVQQNDFDKIKYTLNSLPNDILELQTLLRSLLKNIIVNNYKEDLVGTKEFYIPEDSIFMMKNNDSYKTEYIKFLQFMIQELYKNNLDYSENTGDIITTHSIPSATQEDNKEIDTIKKKYERIYLDNLQTVKTKKAQTNTATKKLHINIKYKNKHGKTYPYYIDDLLDKSRTIIYDEKEAEINIPNILTQDDKEFIETLKKRVQGLQKCYDDENTSLTSELKKQYYEIEFLSETAVLPENYLTEGKTNDELKEKIKLVCRNIKWGENYYMYHQHLLENFNFDEFEKFVTEHQFELDYLKTILPPKCFSIVNNSTTLNKIEIMTLMNDKDKNRMYRQYIFGFKTDVEKYAQFKLFYEIYNIDSGRMPKCHTLVNWSIILNMLYNRCAISNNDIIFPARFILPDKKVDTESKSITGLHSIWCLFGMLRLLISSDDEFIKITF